jgi:hypothetical protein
MMSQPNDRHQTENSIVDIAAGDSRVPPRRLFEYRAYSIGSDGHFVECAEMICGDDGEAVAKAKGLLGASDIEVWNHNRFVIRLVRTPR